MSDETKLCTNCKQQIAAQSFITHELHCHRHLQLCDKCSEPVCRDQMEQHNAERHKMVYCKQCGQHMENGVLSQHQEEECTKRKVKCSFCEVELVVEEREHHQSYCGSRTEPCVKCGRRIMLLDQAQHDATDCAFPPPPAHRPSSPGTGGIWAESSDDDGEDNADSDAVTDAGHRDATVTSGESGLDAEFMLPCERCQKLFAPEQLEDHQNQCMAFDDNLASMMRRMTELLGRAGSGAAGTGAAGTGGGEGGDGGDESDDDGDGSLLPCENCGKSFTMNKYIYHQTVCKAPEDTDFKFVGNDTDAQSKHTSDNLQPSTTDVSMIPCEFCSEFYPADVLYSHQGSCDAYRGNRNRQTLFHDLASDYRGSPAHSSKPAAGGSMSATGDGKPGTIVPPQPSAGGASKSIVGVTLPPFGQPVPGPAVRPPLILRPLPSDDQHKLSGSAASYIPAPAVRPPLILRPLPTDDHHKPSSALEAGGDKGKIEVTARSEEEPSSSPTLAEKYHPTSPNHEEAEDTAKAEGSEAHLTSVDSKQSEGSPPATLAEESRPIVAEILVSQPVFQSVSLGRRSEASARQLGKSAANKHTSPKTPSQAKPQYVWDRSNLRDKHGERFGVTSNSNVNNGLKKTLAPPADTKPRKEAAAENGTLASEQQPVLNGRDKEASVAGDMQATLGSTDDSATAGDL